MTFLGHITRQEGHDYWREQWMKSMQEAAVATLEAHTTLAVDDGAANEPEPHVVGFDPLANCWTGAIVPSRVLRLQARVEALEAELARMKEEHLAQVDEMFAWLDDAPKPSAKLVLNRIGVASDPPAKTAIPARALKAKRQRIGLFLPEGF